MGNPSRLKGLSQEDTHYNDNNDSNNKAEEIFLVQKRLGKSHSLMHTTKPALVFHAGQGDRLEIHLYSRSTSAHGCHLPTYFSNQVLLLLSSLLEITVSHPTLSDQILKMSGQFHIMIGDDDRTSHQHILTYLCQGVVSQ